MPPLGLGQARSVGLSDASLPVLAENARLFRALAYLTVHSRIEGMGFNGRIPGRVNINTVWDPSILQAMAGLKALNLYHTFVTEKGWQEIKSALPGCEIVFDRDSGLPDRRSNIK